MVTFLFPLNIPQPCSSFSISADNLASQGTSDAILGTYLYLYLLPISFSFLNRKMHHCSSSGTFLFLWDYLWLSSSPLIFLPLQWPLPSVHKSVPDFSIFKERQTSLIASPYSNFHSLSAFLTKCIWKNIFIERMKTFFIWCGFLSCAPVLYIFKNLVISDSVPTKKTKQLFSPNWCELMNFTSPNLLLHLYFLN